MSRPTRNAPGYQRLDSVSGGSDASVEATEPETPPENLHPIANTGTPPQAP
ncbi:hypothetical protein [Methylobacterium phyllostachyos]|uniref:hypothetical protein n=1 Tax=Methylobacterium phyllostachyos TaxID=582672 RepID=UPI0014318AF1|nr:hypothetical protein [Methylobacterium phyllostachyos]